MSGLATASSSSSGKDMHFAASSIASILSRKGFIPNIHYPRSIPGFSLIGNFTGSDDVTMVNNGTGKWIRIRIKLTEGVLPSWTIISHDQSLLFEQANQMFGLYLLYANYA